MNEAIGYCYFIVFVLISEGQRISKAKTDTAVLSPSIVMEGISHNGQLGTV